MTKFFSIRLFGLAPRCNSPSVMRFIDLYRQRSALAALDDHILQDIGLTRTQAETEADRPVWDAPENWKR